MTAELVVRPTASIASSQMLTPGRDLVLEAGWGRIARVPVGVALDDHLTVATRPRADALAARWMDEWRRARPELVVGGVDLVHIWELELFARCFLPASRLQVGLEAIVADRRPAGLIAAGLDAPALGLLVAAAVGHGLGVRADGATPDAIAPAHVRPARRVRAARSVGIPPRVRGDILVLSHWALAPVVASLARRPAGPRPVAAGVVLPGLGRRETLRAAVRGGWAGHPPGRALARSRRRLDALIARLDDLRRPDAWGAALDRAALSLLQALAGETFADVAHARRTLDAGVGLVMLPYDSPATARVVLTAARERGTPSLLVQHGIDARLNVPDKDQAEHVAVWSEGEAAHLRGRIPGRVVVTGNPGVAHLAGAPVRGRATTRGRTIVLVDYPSRMSTVVRARIGVDHTAAALRELARLRPRSEVVVRPHPADPHPDAYLALGTAHADLALTVDAATPIEALLGSADLCVGAMSTATLQAAALGVPTVVLDVAQVLRPPPFDGSGPLARVVEPADLAEAAADTMATDGLAARAAAAEALGVRADATERVCALAERIATGQAERVPGPAAASTASSA